MRTQLTPSQTNLNSKVSRKANLDRIRNSMQNFGLIKQNQMMAQTKLMEKLEKKRNSPDSTEDGKSAGSEPEEIHSDFCRVELFLEKYELLEKMGEGSNGVVNKCRKRQSGKEFAVKSFRFEQEHLAGLKANFLFMKNIRHQNLVKYEALYFDLKKRTAWLVMELVKAPSLNVVTLTTEDEIKRVMWQVLDALSYLHNHDIVHRDIKPENILYDPETKKIKIIDFGISKRFRRRGALFDMWTITGTLYYRAPEMFSGGYREGIDVWAAGVLLYWLVCGHTPFESVYHNETIQNILEADLLFPSAFSRFSTELKSLITSMLKRNSEQRLPTCSCLRDSWFSNMSSHPKTGNVMGGSSKEMTMVVQRQKNRANTCRLKNKISLRPVDDDSSILSERTSVGLNMVRPYTKKINGAEFCCIDSEWK